MGGETLSMKTVDFLQALTYQGRNAISKIQNTHLFPTLSNEQNLSSLYTSYKGMKFQYEEPRPDNSLMK